MPDRTRGPTRFLTIAIALSGAILISLAQRSGIVVNSLGVAYAEMLVLLALVLTMAIGWEGYNAAKLGLRPPSLLTLGTAVLLAAFLIGVFAPVAYWLLGRNIGGFEAVRSNVWNLNSGILLFNALIVAFEEVNYRGYGIARLEELTGSTTISIVISTVAFGLAHVPLRGWDHSLIVAIGGAIISMIYVWRRDLIAIAAAHYMTNLWVIAAGG